MKTMRCVTWTWGDYKFDGDYLPRRPSTHTDPAEAAEIEVAKCWLDINYKTGPSKWVEMTDGFTDYLLGANYDAILAACEDHLSR